MGRKKIDRKKDVPSEVVESPEEEEEDVLDLDDELGEEGIETLGYSPKKKPELTPDLKRALRLRSLKKSRVGPFRRQEWFRYKRLGIKWRKPRGLHSKMRRNMKYRSNIPRIGYGAPSEAKGLHPSGFKEVMVYNVKELDGIEPKTEAARIGHGVGTRKRKEILERARERGIRVLNSGGM